MTHVPKSNNDGFLSRWGRRVTIGAQAIVIDLNRRIHLVRHGYRHGWHFPGGGVERRETIAAALRRELLEEGGIELIDAPRMFGIYSHFDEFPGDHIVLFIVESWRRQQVPAPNREIIEQGFFDLEALPEDLTPGSRRRIAEVFYGEPRSLAW